jgi:hypothetical protein
MLPYLSSAFSPSVSFSGFLVMRDQVEVGTLACGVILSADSTPIHPITGCPSLFPPSHTRTPIGSSYDSLSPGEEKCRLTTFRLRATGWVRDYLFAGGFLVCDRRRGSSYTTPLTFWFKAFSTFALLVLTTFIGSSHLFPIPPHSSSRPP